jgi:hypothetical protein
MTATVTMQRTGSAVPAAQMGRVDKGLPEPLARWVEQIQTAFSHGRDSAMTLAKVVWTAQSSAHLPSSWGTLYLLAQFDSKALAELIGQGKIHPALTIQEARNLLPGVKARHRPGRSRVQKRLSSFKDFVRSTLNNWTAGERDLVQDELLQLAREVASSGAVLQERPYPDSGSAGRVEQSRCPSRSESINHCGQITLTHFL